MIDKLIDVAKKGAADNMERDGTVTSIIFLLEGSTPRMFPADMGDKNKTACMLNVLRSANIPHFMISEMWMVVAEKQNDTIDLPCPPSEHEDRIEGIMIQAFVNGEQRLVTAPIHRDGKPTIGEWSASDSTHSIGGRFCEPTTFTFDEPSMN